MSTLFGIKGLFTIFNTGSVLFTLFTIVLQHELQDQYIFSNKTYSHVYPSQTSMKPDVKLDKLYEREILRWFTVIMKKIEEYENTFPTSADHNFSKKRVLFNKTKLENLIGINFLEERRKQKWAYYLRKPPNDKMKKLAARLKRRKVNQMKIFGTYVNKSSADVAVGRFIDRFSRGVAQAFKFLSIRIQNGLTEIYSPTPLYVCEDASIALEILTDDLELPTNFTLIEVTDNPERKLNETMKNPTMLRRSAYCRKISSLRLRV